MGNYHPHGDTSIYDALVVRGPAVVDALPAGGRPGRFGSPGNDRPRMRYTEARLTPLAMEMLANIDEDGRLPANYGKNQNPLVCRGASPTC